MNTKNHIYFIMLFLFLISSCGNDDVNVQRIPNMDEEEVTDEEEPTEPTEFGEWTEVFTENFDDLRDWTLTNRADFNSASCMYQASQVSIAPIDDNNNGVMLTAQEIEAGSYISGHIKSRNIFIPDTNEEIRFISMIRLSAISEEDVEVPFEDTYGAWPAFWTVEENNWPVAGEIDIMEAYTFADPNVDRYACNMFFGDNPGNSILRHEDTEFRYTENINQTDWNMYEMRWSNFNGVSEINIYINDVFVKKYNNDLIPNLRLEDFTAHNVIFNLNVADDVGIFDNSLVNILTQTEMLVDYLKVEKRTLQ